MVRSPGLGAAWILGALVACNAINGSGDLTIGGGGDSTEQPGRSDAVISVDALDFGETPCAADAVLRSLSISEKGGAGLDWKIEVPEVSPFAVVGLASGRIEAGAKVDVTLRAKVFTAGPSEADVLVTAGGVAKNVRLRVVGRGSTFEAAPASAVLGDVRMQSGGAASVTVQNRGNAPLVVEGFDGEDANFTASWPERPSSFTVPEGGSSPITVRLATGTESAPLTALLVPRIQGTVCGAPAPIVATGKRVNLDVTLSPGAFGTIDCGGAVTKEVVITSYVAQTLSYAATLPAASAFSIDSGAKGVLAAGSAQAPTTATIVVKLPPGAPLGDITEALSVEIAGVAAPSGGTRSVPVTAKVSGVIVTVTPSSILDFQATAFSSQTRSVAIANNGNATAGLTWSLVRTSGDPAWQYTGFPNTLPPGTSVMAQVRFQPSVNCSPCAATISHVLVGPGKLCTPAVDLRVQGIRL
jgi:hypothetical protein